MFRKNGNHENRWRHFDVMGAEALLRQSTGNLRKYACHGCGVAGASKTPGGKTALVAAILATRKVVGIEPTAVPRSSLVIAKPAPVQEVPMQPFVGTEPVVTVPSVGHLDKMLGDLAESIRLLYLQMCVPEWVLRPRR